MATEIGHKWAFLDGDQELNFNSKMHLSGWQSNKKAQNKMGFHESSFCQIIALPLDQPDSALHKG